MGIVYFIIDILSDSATVRHMDVLSSKKLQRVDAPIRHQVEDMLRTAIVRGRFKPGMRLIESRLCASLEVSRPVVREALRQLVAEKLVVMIPNRGARVATVTVDEARQIYEVRAQLEGLAGRGFAIHADVGALESLKAMAEELEQAVLHGAEANAILGIKERFYDILLDNCGNRVVCESFQALNNRIAVLRALSVSRPGRGKVMMAEINLLVGSLERRDQDSAFDLCVAHVESAAENSIAAILEGGFVDETRVRKK